MPTIHRSKDHRPETYSWQIQRREKIPESSFRLLCQSLRIKFSGNRGRKKYDRFNSARFRQGIQSKQSHPSTGGMANQMNRLAGEVALVVHDDISNDPGLFSIMCLHCQMKRIPDMKPPPIRNSNRVRNSGCNQSASNAVIDGAATLDARKNDNQAVLLPLFVVEPTMKPSAASANGGEAE